MALLSIQTLLFSTMTTTAEFNESEKRVLNTLLSGLSMTLKLEKGFFDDHLSVRVELLHEDIVVASAEDSIYWK